MPIVTLLPPEDGNFGPLEDALADAGKTLGIPTVNPGYSPHNLLHIDARSTPGSHTEIVIDDEMNCRVVQLLGDNASLEMPVKSDLPYLVLQLKNLNRYVCFEVTIKGIDGVKRHLICNSKQSISRITKTSCSIPLELTEGWNYLCLDLQELVEAAFGVQYSYTTKVAVYSTTRLWRAFFQDRKYSDMELPSHLRTSPTVV